MSWIVVGDHMEFCGPPVPLGLRFEMDLYYAMTELLLLHDRKMPSVGSG